MSSTLLEVRAVGLREADAEALVAEAAAGREQGLAGLYDLYGRRAYGLALRVLRDETLAEDAVQEAFLTVWRTRGRLPPRAGTPSAWILTIVHRRAVDIVRREQRRRADPSRGMRGAGRRRDGRDGVLARAEGGASAGARAARPDAAPRARARLLRRAHSVRDRRRARAPLGTIKSRTFTALSRLRSLLDEPKQYRLGVRRDCMKTQAAVGDRSTERRRGGSWSRRCGRATATPSRPLVDANSPWMMRIALSHVSSRASAEDAVQEAWLRCLRGLDGFEGRSALKSWLFVIVTNCARRRAERDSRSVPFSELARREAEGSEPEPLEDRFFDDSHPRWPGGWTTFSPAGSGLPEQRLLAGEVSGQDRVGGARLPEGQRAVFLLRDVEGWSSEDVCDALGITGSNQRVLLHRARTCDPAVPRGLPAREARRSEHPADHVLP